MGYLSCIVERQSHEIATRVSRNKDLVTCEIPGLTNDEIVEMKNFITCYELFVPRLFYVDFTNDVLARISPLCGLTTVNVILSR